MERRNYSATQTKSIKKATAHLEQQEIMQGSNKMRQGKIQVNKSTTWSENFTTS